MRARVNDTELYLDVEGPELVVDREQLRRRSTLIALHGGPGFDQGYLRPGLAPLADDCQLIFLDLRGQGRSAPALNPDVAAYFFTTLAPHYDLRPRLGEIAIPTLVIVGRHDWACLPAASRAIADAIADAHLVELPDAGHFGFSETPAPFLEAVRAHINRIRKQGERTRPNVAAGT